MLLRPELPTTPHTPVTTTAHTPAPACSCDHTTAIQATPPPRNLPSVSTGAIAAVLVGGVVLTGLLTAVAVTAVSVAVAAVVLRSVLHAQRRQH